MTSPVVTAAPEMTLVELDRRLTKEAISGVPVVQDGRLLGVVSRSDVVGALLEEQLDASRIASFYASPYPLSLASIEHLARDARHLAERLAKLRVGEVMTAAPETAAPDESLRDIAVRMSDRRIHRLPVVEGEQLVGIITSLDLVRAIAEHGLGA